MANYGPSLHSCFHWGCVCTNFRLDFYIFFFSFFFLKKTFLNFLFLLIFSFFIFITGTPKHIVNFHLKLNPFAAKMLMINRYFDISAAKRDLKYTPVIEFEKGWSNTIVWFQENWLNKYNEKNNKNEKIEEEKESLEDDTKLLEKKME